MDRKRTGTNQGDQIGMDKGHGWHLEHRVDMTPEVMAKVTEIYEHTFTRFMDALFELAEAKMAVHGFTEDPERLLTCVYELLTSMAEEGNPDTKKLMMTAVGEWMMKRGIDITKWLKP